MRATAVLRRDLGARPRDGACDFLVWAPRAGTVDVALGDPPERTVRLKPAGRGYHQGTVESVEPGTRYRLSLDGGEAVPDPASRSQPDGVHGPSAVLEPRFPWTDDGWTGVRLEDLVLYEIHVGAFTPQGTFDAVIPRLEALADLGVTAIELMPVAAFPGARNWGYDGVFPFAAQESYGGAAGLARLVDAAHARGLGVVLDVVYNHLGPEGNVLPRFGPYFREDARTPWGPAVNYGGRGSDEVRRFFLESALWWIRDLHVDGLRLDAVQAIRDPSPRPFLEELGFAIHMEGDRLGRRVLVIPESDRNDPRLVERLDEGGLGLDAQWSDDYHHALHAILTGERAGRYVDYGSVDCLEWAVEEGFTYAGQRSEFYGRRQGREARAVPAKRFVVYAQNHDQVGNRAGSERLSRLVGRESRKLAAAAVLLSPFAPLLFMGEEYGETAPFPYFTDHSDPGLGEAVRKGREAELADFDLEAGIPDPQDPETFERARIDWAGREEPGGERLLALYREALRLRREVPALARLDKEALAARGSDAEGVLVVERWVPGSAEAAVLVLHFGEEEGATAVELEEGTWRRRLDTAEERWGGPGSRVPEAIEAGDEPVALDLRPRSALLLTRG